MRATDIHNLTLNLNFLFLGKMLPTTPSVVEHKVKHFVISSCVIKDLQETKCYITQIYFTDNAYFIHMVLFGEIMAHL